MSDFDRIKKTVIEIELLQDSVEDLSNVDSEDLLLHLVQTSKLDLGNNTLVLLKESADKLIDDVKKLLEYEIGERMKKLNVKA